MLGKAEYDKYDRLIWEVKTVLHKNANQQVIKEATLYENPKNLIGKKAFVNCTLNHAIDVHRHNRHTSCPCG